MARSIWKGIFIPKSIYYSLNCSLFFKQHRWSIAARSAVIPRAFLNSVCGVHKGIYFRQILIRDLHIGHKFGEFAFTRKNYHFTPKEKKSKLRR